MQKLSRARIGVLRAIAAGSVVGSCDVYDPRFPKWEQAVPGSRNALNVTPQYHALVDLGLVVKAKPRIGFMVRAMLTDEGRAELARLDAEPAASTESAKCPDCGKAIRLKADGTLRFHLRKKDSWYRPPECTGSGQPPASINNPNPED